MNKVSKQLQDQQTDLGKAAQLISSLREDLVDIRNSNLTDVYADSISELCNKCNIPLTTLCKRRKPKHFEEYIAFECTGQRPAASSPTGRLINSYYPILDCLICGLDNRFSNESAVIFRGISALCPGGQTFLSTHDLKNYATAYSLNAADLQHEIPIVKKLIIKQPDPPKSMAEFLSFLCSYKAVFDCLFNLLLISVTLPVTSASCERSFSKMKLVKTFLRNSMNDDRLSDIALLSIESSRAEKVDLENFVDEFDSHHENRRIKLH